ncbi:hypothetical protein E6O75_ATG04148 [Venturia nashicola]|uniref:CMP/dCMP-type deaminase domain-containing protein n=1 Tax=Venturia nashicola TaxID=86259 RepID=A0A4Z1P707_9PEZI|nr:hypothetical protein E6O75_ATG04148 [Venturia nashicola]
MKTNSYMSLCHGQAILSPLHYRHGCVIVRGGKVIGQGFNDLRTGFDGGALKHGRIASVALDGPAIVDLKRKRKLKPQSEPKSSNNTNSKSFTPYEAMGGGHRANVPLSMHSEMMAIHSAIARSSTLTAIAVSSVKPSFKLPGNSKRTAKLRHEALKAYVKLVCCAALDQQQQLGARQSGAQRREGKYSVQEWRFETSASESEQGVQQQEQRQGGCERGEECGEIEPSEEQEKESSHAEEGVHVAQSAFKESTMATKSFRNDGSISSGYSLGDPPTDSNYKTNSKKNNNKNNTKLAKTEPLLISNGRNRQQTNKVTDRQRHSLLAGADLYVARFGSQNTKSRKQNPSTACCDHPPDSLVSEPLPVFNIHSLIRLSPR